MKMNKAREDAKLTQESVARIMGVTARTIRNWESGEVKMGVGDEKLYWEIINGTYPSSGGKSDR